MARDGLKITGRELSALSGVPYATLARFETGATIRADGLRKLEKALLSAGATFHQEGGRLGVTVPE